MSPSGDNMRGGPQPDSGSGSGSGTPYPAPQPEQNDPRQAMAAMKVATIVSAARQLSSMFPAVNSECRDVLNLMTKMQSKLVNSKPAPEPSAPPV